MEVPANPNLSWFVGVLITAIVAMGGLFAFILKYYLTNYVPKSVYEETCRIIKIWEKRCQDCEYARSKKLEQINKLLGEITSLNSLIIQSLGAINMSMNLVLSKSGGILHEGQGIRGPDVETYREPERGH